MIIIFKPQYSYIQDKNIFLTYKSPTNCLERNMSFDTT